MYGIPNMKLDKEAVDSEKKQKLETAEDGIVGNDSTDDEEVPRGQGQAEGHHQRRSDDQGRFSVSRESSVRASPERMTTQLPRAGDGGHSLHRSGVLRVSCRGGANVPQAATAHASDEPPGGNPVDKRVIEGDDTAIPGSHHRLAAAVKRP